MQARKREAPERRVWQRVVALPLVVSLLLGGWANHGDAAAQSFLWRATSPQAPQSVVYLVGSVHLLSQDYYPLNPALDTAFKDSSLLVEEVDMGDMLAPGAQLQLLTRGMLPDGQSLDKVVSSATFTLVSKTVSDLGLPVESLKQFKPWMIALTLLALEWQKAGFDAGLGIDKHFYDRAKTEGKAVQGLETVEFQVARFDEMPMPDQDHLLAESLKELDTETASVKTLADAWKAGDAPTVERIVMQDLKADPAIYQRLLVDRNKTWLPKIEALFSRPGHAFVVVGAAHLVGPDGLLAMLRAKGYAIQQM